jgi:AcrR family transcriptional regulator
MAGSVGTPKGERTRRQLIEAARRVFGKSGYHNAEIAEICREAGKATGVFYLYFKNKQHLLYTMIFECRAAAPHGWLMHGNDKVALSRNRADAVRGFWDWYKRYQPDLFALMQAASVDESFLAEWREIRAHGNATLARTIARLQTDGYCLGLDPALAASALTGMAFFCCYNWLSQKIDFGARALDEELAISTLTQLINNALACHEPGPTKRCRQASKPRVGRGTGKAQKGRSDMKSDSSRSTRKRSA